MYPTEKMGNFQPAMLVYQRVDFFFGSCATSWCFLYWGGVTKSNVSVFFSVICRKPGNGEMISVKLRLMEVNRWKGRT